MMAFAGSSFRFQVCNCAPAFRIFSSGERLFKRRLVTKQRRARIYRTKEKPELPRSRENGHRLCQGFLGQHTRCQTLADAKANFIFSFASPELHRNPS
jgi:hypothetical protein